MRVLIFPLLVNTCYCLVFLCDPSHPSRCEVGVSILTQYSHLHWNCCLHGGGSLAEGLLENLRHSLTLPRFTSICYVPSTSKKCWEHKAERTRQIHLALMEFMFHKDTEETHKTMNKMAAHWNELLEDMNKDWGKESCVIYQGPEKQNQ